MPAKSIGLFRVGISTETLVKEAGDKVKELEVFNGEKRKQAKERRTTDDA